MNAIAIGLQEEQYEVRIWGTVSTCDWRSPLTQPRGLPIWTMSSREGVQWVYDGILNEAGKCALLTHFGLEEVASDLPLQALQAMSPHKLLELRRSLEQSQGLTVLDEPVSTRVGGVIRASLVA